MSFNSNNVEDSFHEWNEDLINELQLELSTIEKIIIKELHALEESLSSRPEEEAPQTEPPPASPPLLNIARRIKSALQRRARAEGRVLREQHELKEQLNEQQALFREVEMERDVLLQQVHSYLQTNSSLRVRLEEQRCQTGAVQRQVNADLEERIKALEKEKERLSDLNAEKDKKIHDMHLVLEQTAKCFQKKESEVLKMKNNENNVISSLKGDLQSALEEKKKAEDKYRNLKGQIDEYFLGKNFERLSIKENSSLKKSLSAGDVSCAPFNSNKTEGLDPSRRTLGEGGFAFKPCDHVELVPEFLLGGQKPRSLWPFPGLWRSVPTSQPPAPDPPKKEKKADISEPPVHTQLTALKRGLMNVTRKLEMLKCQLVSSGAIEEDPRTPENPRSLKRKASVAEEAAGPVSEDPKSGGFKNLRSILEDAKNLNAKLQNMREEKQRIIEMNKREAGIQVGTKKNDEVCQTVDQPETAFRDIQTSLTKLRKEMKDCEEKLDGHQINAIEAYGWFASALFAYVLSNFKHYQEWRRRTDPWFGDETDTNSLMDEGSNGSREVTSPGENGGGDNLLKKRISRDGLSCAELKIQMDRLIHKIERKNSVGIGDILGPRRGPQHSS